MAHHDRRIKTAHDRAITLNDEQWTGTYPVAELSRRLAFHRGQRAKFVKAKVTYDPTIAALGKLSSEICQ
ncbi:hypothetical protein [Paracoccus onubensis]|uniref:hypothetical protein n=1 Tax=Paracoccus onubensis TaxID=1675788 RepID=UPI0011C3A467|nr:hypothetical protein [Paracoccus onubensis]